MANELKLGSLAEVLYANFLLESVREERCKHNTIKNNLVTNKQVYKDTDTLEVPLDHNLSPLTQTAKRERLNQRLTSAD